MYDYPQAVLDEIAAGYYEVVDLFKITLGDTVYRWASGDRDHEWEGDTYTGRSPLAGTATPKGDKHRRLLNVGLADPEGTWEALIKSVGETGNPIEHYHCTLTSQGLTLVETLDGVTDSIGTSATGEENAESTQLEAETVIVCTGAVLKSGQVITRTTSDHSQRENIDSTDFCYYHSHLLDLYWSV